MCSMDKLRSLFYENDKMKLDFESSITFKKIIYHKQKCLGGMQNPDRITKQITLIAAQGRHLSIQTNMKYIGYFYRGKKYNTVS